MRYIVYNRWMAPVFEWTNLLGICLFMAVDRKNNLLALSSFFRLRLAHAAVVDGYECHAPRASMAVNRLLLVSADDGRGESVLRDLGAGQELTLQAGHYYFIPCDHVVGLDIVPSLRFQSLQFNLDLFYGFGIRDDEVVVTSVVLLAAKMLGQFNCQRRLAYRCWANNRNQWIWKIMPGHFQTRLFRACLCQTGREWIPHPPANQPAALDGQPDIAARP